MEQIVPRALEPFECERAREWRPDVTCDDPEDISQDGSRLWAIDKPNIALPPPGWERQIRIRGEGGTKFADVLYFSFWEETEPGQRHQYIRRVRLVNELLILMSHLKQKKWS
ncbi:hypothetical protein E2562_003422 [Oryza meyeriana var. granulata]|uniref:Uncharacterized protein n=1 Tax=Oryza meyeriana var. granulata TaxID=110450 RepID=A0A6G1EEV3_9ORYZ|nr:hypothetical protein E2562_003422 [Oryza meyeriana var. granulata]